MDELASRSQDKLLMFRLMELKDVLGRIGMTKQGRKQVLKDRIMNLLAPSDLQGHKAGLKSNVGGGKLIAFGREEVAKIIDDIFRKMKGCEADDPVSKVQNMPKSVGSVDEDEYEETGIIEAKTRCSCGSSIDRDIMIQCDNNKCKAWQHLACVVIPEKTGEAVQAGVPSLFYCESCRINRADPFSLTVSEPVLPIKLTTSSVKEDGSSLLQNIEKTFILTRSDIDLLQNPGCDLQVWCILLNDTVMFRMHWPQYSDLRVNGVSVRVTNRPGPQLLGANGRDDGSGITACCQEGTNKISLSAYDARQFCLGVRIIRRQTVQQVLSLVPGETEGETFQEGLARVQRCIGAVGSLGNVDDCDSDLEVVAESITVNLRCPMSGSRMNVAGRFKSCEHMGCFDLQTFIELNECTRKWQCPICLKNYSLEDIVIDQYFSRIASAMKGYPEDVTEVEVKPDGSWCSKHEVEENCHEKWHLQEGSFPISNGDAKMKFQISSHMKQEGHISEACVPLRVGMKRNYDGHWELHRAKDSTKHSNAFNKNKKQKLIKFPQCSNATKSNRIHEHTSINQETSENLYILVGNDPNSYSTSLGLVCSLSSVIKNTESQVQKDSKVIVLSDSEEEVENELIVGSSTASAFAGSDNPDQDGFHAINSSEDLPEVLISHNSMSSVPCGSSTLSSLPYIANGPLDLFGLDAFKIDPPNWSDNSQNVDTDAPDSVAISQQISARSTSVTIYNTTLQEQSNLSSVPRIPYDANSPYSPQNYFSTEINDTFIENLSGIDNGEASLQSFLSPEPAQTSVQGDKDEPIVDSDTLQTNWTSHSLARSEITGIYTHETYITNRREAADQRNTALNMSTNGTRPESMDTSGHESPL